MGTKFGGDIRVTLDSGKKFLIPDPPVPVDNYNEFKKQYLATLSDTNEKSMSFSIPIKGLQPID